MAYLLTGASRRSEIAERVSKFGGDGEEGPQGGTLVQELGSSKHHTWPCDSFRGTASEAEAMTPGLGGPGDLVLYLHGLDWPVVHWTLPLLK